MNDMSFMEWALAPIVARLTRIEAKINATQLQLSALAAAITAQGVRQMAAIDDLSVQVTENTNVEQSAIQLINNIAAMLAGAGTDPAKLQELQNTLKASAAQLAAAISANTPPPAPAPTPNP